MSRGNKIIVRAQIKHFLWSQIQIDNAYDALITLFEIEINCVSYFFVKINQFLSIYENTFNNSSKTF